MAYRKGTLIQVRFDDKEIEKIDSIAKKINGPRTQVLKFALAQIEEVEVKTVRTGGAK